MKYNETPEWHTVDGDKVTEVPRKVTGFIYELTYKPKNIKYVGKKNTYKVTGVGRRRVVTESNWKRYWGTSDTLKQLRKDDKNPASWERIILAWATSPRELTYLETKYQFMKGVLESKDYCNKNILGKFYKGNIK